MQFRSFAPGLGAVMGFTALLAACATDPAPATRPPPVERAGPPPAPSQPLGTEEQAEVAAPGVTVETPAPPPEPAGDGAVVVPGRIEQPLPAPPGDTRSTAQRARDIRAWDRCVLRMQARGEESPTRPALESPEEICARELGMASRTAPPQP